jgi:hypothetical protein
VTLENKIIRQEYESKLLNFLNQYLGPPYKKVIPEKPLKVIKRDYKEYYKGEELNVVMGVEKLLKKLIEEGVKWASYNKKEYKFRFYPKKFNKWYKRF